MAAAAQSFSRGSARWLALAAFLWALLLPGSPCRASAGNDLAVEADSNWNVLASYFYEPGVDAPISRTASGSTVYYLADNAGSITALANSSGGIIGRYYWSPWGELISQDSGMPTQPLGWTGRELDETGLYYLRGRYYSPTLGRFLSEDPAGLEANLNLYLFALNNPVGSRDGFGLQPQSVPGRRRQPGRVCGTPSRR